MKTKDEEDLIKVKLKQEKLDLKYLEQKVRETSGESQKRYERLVRSKKASIKYFENQLKGASEKF